MAFTRSGVRSPSPPLGRTVGLSDGRPDTANDSRSECPTVRPSDSGWSPRTGAVKLRPRGNSSVGRAQPWQGCALPTELFPRGRNLTAPVRGDHPESDGRTVGHSDRESFAVSGRPSDRPTVRPSGGEGDRTPDLVNAIHALSQLSYAPCILGPGKTRSGGNTASYRGVLMVSSDRAPWHELSGVWPVSQDVPGPIAMAIHALSQLSYAPCILGPGKTRSGGNTASYRGVLMVSSDRAPWHELSGVWPVSQDVPGPIAMAKHMRRKVRARAHD